MPMGVGWVGGGGRIVSHTGELLPRGNICKCWRCPKITSSISSYASLSNIFLCRVSLNKLLQRERLSSLMNI